MGVGKEAKVGLKSAAINCHRYISKIGRSSLSVPKRSRERGWAGYAYIMTWHSLRVAVK